MADLPPENDLHRTGHPRASTRQRYILQVTTGYALLAVLWISLSDRLITALVDVAAIQWLSTAKGLFFVVVTTLLLYLFLRGVPGEDTAQPTVPGLGLLLAAPPRARPWIYAFAVVASLAMLLVRSGIAVSFGEQPLLILFIFPITLSAMAGGLGPGLLATLVSALGAAYGLPPLHSLWITASHDLFQWGFLIANGVLVSILAEVLHRLRLQTEASRELQAVTLASIGDGVITTDTRGQITFMNPEAEKMTGWGCREAMDQPVTTVFPTIHEQSRQPVADPVHKVLTTGQEVELTNHTLLLSRDGREVAVQDSGAPIRLANGAMVGVVLVFRDDTRRRQAEMALQQERTFLKSLVQTLPDLVWLKNPEGVYLACNARFERFFGAKEAEIVGKTDYDFMARELAEFFRGKDREAIAKGRPSLNEEEVTFADDGHREMLETIKTPMRDSQGHLIGVLGIARDITAARRAEEALRDSELTYRSLFENMLNGFAFCRMIFANETPVDFVYLSVNHAFATLTGLTDVVGRRVSEVIPGIREADPRLFEIYGRVARGGAAERFEIFVDALRMWFAISVYSPKHEHFVAVFDVITDRKQAEAALRDSLAEKVALLKEVHHRVKNNLQIVASLLNLQAKQIANQEVVAALIDTRNRVHSMALLHEVLYRSENLARIHLAAYLEELCTHLRRSFGQVAERVRVERRIAAISLPLDQAVPCGLIINELVTNAMKYGFPGDSSGRILVEVGLDQGRIELTVSDTGVGLAPGFDPAATSTLGLQLVTNLAGQLGGGLRWERGPEGGARFRVSFPAPPETTAQGDLA